ncbi:Subtilisin-like protease [Rhynchospora pubera]|uniref:Subtilisin-like protease n=1 Tax=Rhynchospora pubera TaxID=906938 RepID=A0AAV8F8K5_9POAL|nr:Subtilisin-like protease [Rhynchospora pubera]KAJ4809128.1 Subtilisin-like protease [Rhynchospora pubera]
MKGIEVLCLFLLLVRSIVSGSHDVYIVAIEGDPVVSYEGNIEGLPATATDTVEEMDFHSDIVRAYSIHLENKHNEILDSVLLEGSYTKLYTYRHLINGFAVHMNPLQAEALRRAPGVKYVERDTKVRKLTTHTPQFLGLSTEVWPTGGGFDRAGEDIVIGFVDSGIYPKHPSFSTYNTEPFGPLPRFKGKCEADPETRRSYCNGKIVGAQHFAKAAIAAGAFNPAIDFASPLDGDGHGSHTAAIAAGNNGVPVRLHGREFGKASGMAPRARIAVYKVLYRLFGGYVSDVVAAIEQAVEDGVDILNLSVGPNSPPSATRTTFLNPFDAALLSAVKAGVFVAQAAGNGGPFPKTLVSFSPWITTVAAGVDDRRYKNQLILGNGINIPGLGVSPATHGNRTMNLVSASDVLIGSSVVKYNPLDCQRPELLNKNKVEGNILLCGYSFNFVSGTASIKKVSETAKSLHAAGFVVAVENNYPGIKFDPVPVSIPGIVITEISKTKELIDYYNCSTRRDWAGRAISFEATASIANGLAPTLYNSAPQVAIFSSRGPDVKDFSFQDADVLKPDILAPGNLIWAAWAPNGTDEANYVGEGFAMISGTSMAAPHISGIAALLKQKNPKWSPAAIKSALMTTATTLDKGGRPLKAQEYSGQEILTLASATPFDYGSGAVNPKAAVDPGLVFDASHADYIKFLCSVPGIDRYEVRNITGVPCTTTYMHPADLNIPSVAVSHLKGTRIIKRTVTNVGSETETYTITSHMSPEIALEVGPPAFTILPGQSRDVTITLTARSVTDTYSFGEVLMKGDRGHKVRIPVVAMGFGS